MIVRKLLIGLCAIGFAILGIISILEEAGNSESRLVDAEALADPGPAKIPGHIKLAAYQDLQAYVEANTPGEITWPRLLERTSHIKGEDTLLIDTWYDLGSDRYILKATAVRVEDEWQLSDVR